MNKFLFSAILFLFAFGLQGQIDPESLDNNGSGPVMDFEGMVVDYGTIDQHAEPLRVMKFTNTGTEPLVIKSARGSCGCTVPDWPKEPVMPGEESKIEIRYATNRLGKFSKKVTITTNEGGEPHVLTVQGQVNKAEDDGVPAAPANIFKDVAKPAKVTGKSGN